MKSYSGPFLSKESFIQAEIEVEDGNIENFTEGGVGGEDAIIIPSFYNSHTHLADSVVNEAPVGTIEKIVGPGGLKEEKLSSADRQEVIDSMSGYIAEMAEYGVKRFIDFREEGVEGLKLLKEALASVEEEIIPGIMARPKRRSYDSWELNKLLSMADGIGLSAYRDWDEDQISKVADNVRNEGKPFALHCSEDVREPIEKVLELDVHHLVHMIEAEEEDLERCAEENVPIVICPRSNMFFGKVPDIPKMLESGVTLSLGTDNAMITNGNMFREMETAYRVSMMKGEVSPLEILMMATWNPRKTLDYRSSNNEEHYLILEHREGDPAYNVVINSSPKDINKVVEWKNGRFQ